MTVLVVGCGYTGMRVARSLAAAGHRVIGTVRDPRGRDAVSAAGAEPWDLDGDDPESVEALRELGVRLGAGALVLCTVPPARQAGGRERTSALLDALRTCATRVVYVSSTAVYGDARFVDETTPPSPASERGHLRLAAEEAVARGPWSWLVLRPAAIYGPGRGILDVDGAGFRRARSLDAVVSRIHVEDLAAIARVALLATVSGAFPVADREPASARQMLEVAAAHAGTSSPGPPLRHPPEVPGRVVDGRAVLRELNLELRFATFRAALADRRDHART